VLERALLLINTPYTYFTILCDEFAAASMGFAATVCMHGSTATHSPSSSGAWESLSSDISIVIDRYTDESIKKIGRTKAQVLRAIKNYDIANKKCSEITSTDVVGFANELIIKVAPSTRRRALVLQP
jgi:hypothetical protein